jgi:hypothetical protein
VVGVFPVKGRGWTLHEMLISLSIMGVVAGLASHAAVAQLRFFEGVVDVSGVRSQVAEVGSIVGAVVWGVSPSDGELLAVQDSALEVVAPTGVAVVCAGGVGSVTVASPEPHGNSLASWDAEPDAGDAVRLFVSDSSGTSWLNATVASPPSPGTACPGFSAVSATRQIQLREPIVIPTGAVLRFMRRMRLSLYRASDSRWYFGIREWNVALQRFNAIQPVAGPVLAYSANPALTGLGFRYHAPDGTPLEDPVEASRVAAISVTTRSEATRPVRISGRVGSSDRYVDSTSVTISLRNAR